VSILVAWTNILPLYFAPVCGIFPGKNAGGARRPLCRASRHVALGSRHIVRFIRRTVRRGDQWREGSVSLRRPNPSTNAANNRTSRDRVTMYDSSCIRRGFYLYMPGGRRLHPVKNRGKFCYGCRSKLTPRFFNGQFTRGVSGFYPYTWWAQLAPSEKWGVVLIRM